VPSSSKNYSSKSRGRGKEFGRLRLDLSDGQENRIAAPERKMVTGRLRNYGKIKTLDCRVNPARRKKKLTCRKSVR